MSSLLRRPGQGVERLREDALRALLGAATRHRRQCSETTFIGVTGSAGKTTTKQLISAMLGTPFGGCRAGRNGLRTVGWTVLRTGSRHDFRVVEIAAWEQDSVRRSAEVVRPHIGVITNVGLDHRSAFGGTLAGITFEKAKLLESVVDGGTAVLNADDPNVIAMAQNFPGRVITFGRSPSAMLRAEHIRASWPDRLMFTLSWNGRSIPIATRLCGGHWVSSVLAAIGAVAAMDIPLEQAVGAIASVEPYPARMSPVSHDGVTFIRDDWKAPQWSLQTGFEFLADARAIRKFAVIGTISEGTGRDPGRYTEVARRALDVADEVVFVGPKAKYALKAKCGPRAAHLHSYPILREAAQFLRAELREGDLVLLKGSNRADHLLRLVKAHAGHVGCWRVACDKGVFCDTCWLLHVPARRGT